MEENTIRFIIHKKPNINVELLMMNEKCVSFIIDHSTFIIHHYFLPTISNFIVMVSPFSSTAVRVCSPSAGLAASW